MVTVLSTFASPWHCCSACSYYFDLWTIEQWAASKLVSSVGPNQIHFKPHFNHHDVIIRNIGLFAYFTYFQCYQLLILRLNVFQSFQFFTSKMTIRPKLATLAYLMPYLMSHIMVLGTLFIAKRWVSSSFRTSTRKVVTWMHIANFVLT